MLDCLPQWGFYWVCQRHRSAFSSSLKDVKDKAISIMPNITAFTSKNNVLSMKGTLTERTANCHLVHKPIELISQCNSSLGTQLKLLA